MLSFISINKLGNSMLYVSNLYNSFIGNNIANLKIEDRQALSNTTLKVGAYAIGSFLMTSYIASEYTGDASGLFAISNPYIIPVGMFLAGLLSIYFIVIQKPLPASEKPASEGSKKPVIVKDIIPLLYNSLIMLFITSAISSFSLGELSGIFAITNPYIIPSVVLIVGVLSVFYFIKAS